MDNYKDFHTFLNQKLSLSTNHSLTNESKVVFNALDNSNNVIIEAQFESISDVDSNEKNQNKINSLGKVITIVAIAIVGGKNGVIEDFCPPCGVCRQVLAEFCKKDFLILLKDKKNQVKEFTLEQLLPESFSL